MDERVLQTQQWLNATYANNPSYTSINEDGQTGNATFTALIKALQIELGGITVDGSFGDSTINRLKAVHPTFSEVDDPETAEENNYHYIIQGSLWCKGYNPGGFTGIFGAQTTSAIKLFQQHAGITQDGIVKPYILQGIMNTDGYEFITGTDDEIHKHQVQQDMNMRYGERFGLVAPNGLWERKCHKTLIKCCQFEWGLSGPDGVYGDNTYNAAPTLSKNTSGWTNSKRLLQYALTINGFYPGGLTGTFGDGTYNAVYNFQSFMCLGADGIAGKNTWISLLKSCGYSGRAATACDTATRLTSSAATALKNAGYNIVGRYLTKVPGGLDKNMTAAEIAIMADADLKVFPIFQLASDGAESFTNAIGLEHGRQARDAAKQFGFPDGCTIYFAVDYDVPMADIDEHIIPYFLGISTYISPYKVGVYGPRSVCNALADMHLTEYSMVADMSSGFTGNIGVKMPENWAFDQFFETTQAGIGIDKCIESPRQTSVPAGFLTPACGGEDYQILSHHTMVPVNGQYKCVDCGYQNSFIEMVEDLFRLADQYDSTLSIPQKNLLVLQYIRIRNSSYNSEIWTASGGLDSDFISYVGGYSDRVTQLFIKDLVMKDPTTKRDIDMTHLCATTSALVHTTTLAEAASAIGQSWIDIVADILVPGQILDIIVDGMLDHLAGWGADLWQVGNSAQAKYGTTDLPENISTILKNAIGNTGNPPFPGIDVATDPFSWDDLCGDVDAMNIYTMLSNNTLQKALVDYYSSGYSTRFSTFVSNMGGIDTLRTIAEMFTTNALYKPVMNVLRQKTNTTFDTEVYGSLLANAFVEKIQSLCE